MGASETEHTARSAAASLPAIAEAAGYGGLVPFVLGLLGIGLAPTWELRDLAQRLLLGYGAAILAFVGAVHWGLALAGRAPWSARILLGSIVPALAGAAAAALGGQRGLALLLVGFGVFWLYEHRRCEGFLPPAYLSLRRNLTLATCTLLAFCAFASEAVGLR